LGGYPILKRTLHPTITKHPQTKKQDQVAFQFEQYAPKIVFEANSAVFFWHLVVFSRGLKFSRLFWLLQQRSAG
jgi:hypothetical protein